MTTKPDEGLLDADALAAIAAEAKDEKADSPPKAKPRAKAKPRTSSMERQLTELFELVGGLVSGFDQFDGQIIQQNAGDLAKNLDALAKTNPKARAMLERMLSGGAWSGVGMVLGVQVILPIAVHHGAGGQANAGLAAALGVPVKAKKAPKDKPEQDKPAAARPKAKGKRTGGVDPYPDVDPGAPFTVTDPASA